MTKSKDSQGYPSLATGTFSGEIVKKMNFVSLQLCRYLISVVSGNRYLPKKNVLSITIIGNVVDAR